MSEVYQFRIQTCGFMAHLDMTFDAMESEAFEVQFEVEINEATRTAIRRGVRKIWDESGRPPYLFIVEEINEYREENPQLGFEICAKGAARLILGISNETSNLPFSNVT